MHSIMDPPVGTFAGSIVEPTDVPTEDILPPKEDILPPLLPASEDILTASDNIPVRFEREWQEWAKRLRLEANLRRAVPPRSSRSARPRSRPAPSRGGGRQAYRAR